MSGTPPDAAAQRERMVVEQIEARGVVDPAVLAAMRAVPRERFVAASSRAHAYEDRPLPIEAGQTISQPYMVACMLEAARLGPGDRVLDVGCGSGYAAAVASRVARAVAAVERHAELAALARRRLHDMGFVNVAVHEGDGTLGRPQEAPFDAIVVAASGPRLPPALREQLAEGGRLVMPVGSSSFAQRLVRVTRRGAFFDEDDLGGVVFVPLIGAGGWPR